MNQVIFTNTEVEKFRKETTGCSNVNHLNNAGASLMPNTVTEALVNHIKLESEVGGYEAGDRMALAIQTFYEQAARLLNCKPTNIAFTASATDSFARALSSIPFRKNDIILTDCDDFISNQIQFLSCQKRFGVKIVHIKNAAVSGVDLIDLEEKLYSLQPRFLSITHIPTNSGLVQPVEGIAEIYNRYQQTHLDKTWYMLDACQSIGQMKMDVQQLKCDYLSTTNRKFLRGPRGAGFLFASDRVLSAKLEPLFIDMRGAEWTSKDHYQPQPDAKRFEDWEFAYALVIATAKAIEYCREVGEDRIWNQIQMLSKKLRDDLSEVKSLRLLDRGLQTSSSVTFTVADADAGNMVNQYLKRKINVVASYRNYAVIDFGEKKADWAIRVSPHYFNTLQELDQFVVATEEILSIHKS